MMKLLRMSGHTNLDFSSLNLNHNQHQFEKILILDLASLYVEQ